MVSFLSVIVDSLFYSQCLSKLLGVSGSSFEYQVSLLPLLLFLYFFLLNPSLQYIAKGKKRRKNLLRNWSVVSSWVPFKNYQEDLLGIYFYPSFSTPSFSARFEFFVCSFRFCVALFLRPKTKLLPFPVFLFHSTLSLCLKKPWGTETEMDNIQNKANWPSLTLWLPRSFTEQVMAASLPKKTVTLEMGSVNSGRVWRSCAELSVTMRRQSKQLVSFVIFIQYVCSIESVAWQWLLSF